jgi:predicted ATPase
MNYLIPYIPIQIYKSAVEQNILPRCYNIYAYILHIEVQVEFSRLASNTTELKTDVASLKKFLNSIVGIVKKYEGSIHLLSSHTIIVQLSITKDPNIPTRTITAACVDELIELNTQSVDRNISLQCCIAEGLIRGISIGNPFESLLYVVVSEAIDQCFKALQAEKTLGMITVGRNGEGVSDQQTKVDEAFEFSRSNSASEEGVASHLGNYLPQVITQRILNGQTEFIDEYRYITYITVQYSGIPTGEARLKALQEYFIKVMAFTKIYQGYIHDVVLSGEQINYRLAFGVPIAYEDNKMHALFCAVAIRDIDTQRHKVGISEGIAYCGRIGTEFRSAYTVIGDVTHQSEKLSQQAHLGQILINTSLPEKVQKQFLWEESLSFPNSSVYVLQQIKPIEAAYWQAAQYPVPMVGREHERSIIETYLQAAKTGRGNVVGVVGEAGVGKSRLRDELILMASQYQFTSFGGECHQHPSRIGYQVWEPIWRGFFGIDASWPRDLQVLRLEAQLTSINPSFAQRLPLLSPVFQLDIADNYLTAKLDPTLKIELLHSLLMACLRYRSQRTPILLILEDSHWMDPLSLDLLNFLARNIANLPILMVTLCRPDGEILFKNVTPQPVFIRLHELNVDQSEALITLKVKAFFGNEQLQPDLVNQIASKTQGNPFFIEELIHYLHHRRDDLTIITEVEIPSNIIQLLISRIDQLSERNQLTVKVASVIGQSFDTNWLLGTYPKLGEFAILDLCLQELSTLQFIIPTDPEPSIHYLFRHILTREVAYQSLPITTRAVLHDQIGQYIEHNYASEIASLLGLLAYHYSQSTNENKQRFYYRRAGDASKNIYANAAAIAFYQKLLPIIEAENKAEVLRLLAEVYELIGQWDDAENHYREALANAQTYQQSLEVARCQRDLGHLLLFKASPNQAYQWLTDALSGFVALNATDDLYLTLNHLSVLLLELGNFEQARLHAQQHYNLAEQNDNKIELCRASQNIAWSYRPNPDLSSRIEFTRRALQLAEEAQYLYGLVITNSDFAEIYVLQGLLDKALTSCQHALSAAEAMGFLQGISVIASNIGEIYRRAGNDLKALDCYRYALDIAQQLGSQVQLAFSVNNIAAIYTLNHHPLAKHLLVFTLNLARQLNIPPVICEALYYLAIWNYQHGNYAEARNISEEARPIAEQIGNQEVLQGIALLDIQLRSETVDPAVVLDDLSNLFENWRQLALQTFAQRQALAFYQTVVAAFPSEQEKARYANLIHLDEEPSVTPTIEVYFTTEVSGTLDQLLDVVLYQKG